MTSATVDLEALDLGSLAHFVGLAFNEQVVRDLEARGFPHVKVSYGYVFQCLLEGPHTASEIARRINVSQQAAAKVVSEMMTHGLVGVAEATAATDARAKPLQLTADGGKLIAAARSVRSRIEAQMTQGLTPEQAAAVKRGLIAMLGKLDYADTVAGRRVRPAAG